MTEDTSDSTPQQCNLQVARQTVHSSYINLKIAVLWCAVSAVVCCSVLYCVAVFCSALPCVAVCCSVVCTPHIRQHTTAEAAHHSTAIFRWQRIHPLTSDSTPQHSLRSALFVVEECNLKIALCHNTLHSVTLEQCCATWRVKSVVTSALLFTILYRICSTEEEYPQLFFYIVIEVLLYCYRSIPNCSSILL